jgi:hypothetical protein
MTKRKLLSALMFSNLLAFAPVASQAGECSCSKSCQAACADGKGEACTCKECDCKKGNCKHGKCKHHPKDDQKEK